MQILEQAIKELYQDGIEPVTIRLRFAIVLGIGTIILLYAILSVSQINLMIVLWSTITSTLYFTLLTPNRKDIS